MKKNEKNHFRLLVTSNSYLHAYVVRPIDMNTKNTVFVFSHGFSVDGTESFRLFIQLSEKLVSLGYPCILFDYRGNGYSDLKFEDMTFDTLVEDLNVVADFSKKEFPNYKIAFWGVSLGCAVAASVAAQRKDLSLLILWSLSADLYLRYKERFGVNMEKNGYVYIDKGFVVKRNFLESLKDRDIYLAIKTASIKCLLVHGTSDTTASIELSRTAHNIASKNTTLYEIIDGNHGFKLQPSQYKTAVDLTLAWIDQNLI